LGDFFAILFWQAGYPFALSGKDGDTAKLMEGAKREGCGIRRRASKMPSASSMASTRKYPFIRTEFFDAGSARFFNRILNEARAGKVLFDAVSSQGLKIFCLVCFPCG
jgi:hypothetical protein